MDREPISETLLAEVTATRKGSCMFLQGNLSHGLERFPCMSGQHPTEIPVGEPYEWVED